MKTMARPSKLTEGQWDEIKARLLKGEKAADLARAYKISKASISERSSKRVEIMKAVSNQLVMADQSLKDLPVPEQVTVLNFVEDLKAMSLNIASAGRLGAINANRLSGLANNQLKTVTDESVTTGEGMVALKMVGVLQELANEASKVPLGILAANKDQVQMLNQSLQKVNLKDMSDDELLSIASGSR